MGTCNTTKSSVMDQAICEGEKFTFETVKNVIMVKSIYVVHWD